MVERDIDFSIALDELEVASRDYVGGGVSTPGNQGVAAMMVTLCTLGREKDILGEKE